MSATPQLVSPHPDYQDAFTRYYDDMLSHDPGHADLHSQTFSRFSQYVAMLHNQEKGLDLPAGYAPCSHWWLIEQEQLIGTLRLRHHIDNAFLRHEGGHIGYDIAPAFREQGYGTQLLHLGLAKARQRQLNRVLITADADNQASRRIIERNGGVFDRLVMGRVFPLLIAQYWVHL